MVGKAATEREEPLFPGITFPEALVFEHEDSKQDEKAEMLWDANPAVSENYWSATQRD